MPIILLFIKAPVKGRVKSRLAAAVGEDAALELYRSCILDIIDTAEGTGYPLRICYFPPDAGESVSSWLGRRYQLMPQEGDDLGARMENAFRRVFAEGVASAVLIGSDLPDLPAVIVKEAFEALKTCDATIGPAADGGYYLIGFNKTAFQPRIFHGIEWSTNTVFRETMTLLGKTALRIHLAPEWRDVDGIEDLKALLGRNEDSERTRSRTIAYLRDQGNRIGI